MKIDLLYIYRSLLDAQGIQFLQLNDHFDNIEQIDFSFRKSVLKDYDYSAIVHFLQRLFREHSILMIRDKLNLDYCIFQLPSHVRKEYHFTYGVIGPIIFEKKSASSIKRSMKKNGISENHTDEVMALYHRLPIIPSIDTWHAVLRPFMNELYGKDVPYCITSYDESIQQFEEKEVPDKAAIKGIEDRFYLESQLIYAVSNGESNTAIDWLRKLRNYRFDLHPMDELREKKNTLISLNTLLCQAIQTAGIHPYYVDTIMRKYALSIDHASSINELENLSTLMIQSYCSAVSNRSSKTHSATIDQCLQYIEFFYAQPLTLNKLAQHCFVTSNYLSMLFKKEIGISLMDYINQYRITKAMHLLNTTHFSIQEISSRCGFADANYFSRVFKKINGITPMQYRKNNKNEI